MNALFLCTGNSCRSILAEAVFNHLSPDGWTAMSAGSQPTGTVHPRALALLEREGIPTAGLASKSWEELPATPDVVITLCADAVGEACPAWPGLAARAHWGVEDPARASGDADRIEAAFITTYRILRARIEAFLALPLETLRHDGDALQSELERIGELWPGTTSDRYPEPGT